MSESAEFGKKYTRYLRDQLCQDVSLFFFDNGDVIAL